MEELTASAASAAAEQTQAGAAEQTPAAEPALEANVFGFAPVNADPVGADEGLEDDVPAGSEDPGVNANTPPPADASPAAAPEPPDGLNGAPQKVIGSYWRKERERRDREIAQAKQDYERRLSGDPIRQIGQMMVDNIVAREGKTPEEAAKLAEERFIAAYAKQEGLTPAQARLDMTARRLLGAQQQPAAPAPQQPSQSRPAPQTAQQPSESDDAVERANAVIDELMRSPLPQGFDLRAAVQDEAFVNLLVEYEPKAAVRIYQAERQAKQAPQQIADKLRARQQIPQSTRPQQAVAPEPSYRDLTSEDFFALKERLHKQRK